MNYCSVGTDVTVISVTLGLGAMHVGGSLEGSSGVNLPPFEVGKALEIMVVSMSLTLVIVATLELQQVVLLLVLVVSLEI